MKRYEFVATELGTCLGVSIGTAYALECYKFGERLDSSRYVSRQDLFSELQSLGLCPWEEYLSMINDYSDKKVQSEIAKQRILRYQQNLAYNMKNSESKQ